MALPALALFWPTIWGFIIASVVPLAVHLLKALGFGVITYTGATYVMTAAESYIFANYNNLPTALYSMLTLAGVDAGIKMVFSAMAANVVIKGFSGAAGTKKKMQMVN